MWAFLAATYWVSLVTYYLLWRAYKHVSALRENALMSPEIRAEQFVVLVRDIPLPTDGQTRKEQVDSYFKAIYPDTFYRSLIVTDNTEVCTCLICVSIIARYDSGIFSFYLRLNFLLIKLCRCIYCIRLYSV